MYEKLGDAMALGLSVEQPEGGIFLWGRLPCGCNKKYLQSALIENGVSYVPGNVFFEGGRADENYIRFCYYGRTEEEITEGIRVFNTVFAESMNA